MDLFKSLSDGGSYSDATLQLLVGAWVMDPLSQRTPKVDLATGGDVTKSDSDKRSIHSLLYSLYRAVGEARSETGARYELTFNTWGYAWPEAWGTSPNSADDPQQFGRNAYSGLFHFDQVAAYVAARAGRVHVVELGCGTGAGAHHVCTRVLPHCTYEAVDLQRAAIDICRGKFVPELDGRLIATHADATRLHIPSGCADLVTVCETDVTQHAGQVTDEDRAFFRSAARLLAPGGYLLWSNAIPDSTWQPSFDYLQAIGMRRVECLDVTGEAVDARDLDEPRVCAYVDQCIEKFLGFQIPFLGEKKRRIARAALANLARNPGTPRYDNMVTEHDTYRVSCFQKAA